MSRPLIVAIPLPPLVIGASAFCSSRANYAMAREGGSSSRVPVDRLHGQEHTHDSIRASIRAACDVGTGCGEQRRAVRLVRVSASKIALSPPVQNSEHLVAPIE